MNLREDKATALVTYYANGIPQYPLRVTFIRDCLPHMNLYHDQMLSDAEFENKVRASIPPQANPLSRLWPEESAAQE